MADNWDDEHGAKGAIKDSWEDEDADNVKDAWDAEEEEKTVTSKPQAAKKKPDAAQHDVKEWKDMTEEEKRIAQEEADMRHTTDLFGLEKSLDQISLRTKEGCTDYVNRLYARLNAHSKSDHYQEFLDELFKSLCKNLTSDQVRKLSNSLKSQADHKSAEEKNAKAKDVAAKPKPKAKGKIRLEVNAIKSDFDVFQDGGAYNHDEDEDDFM